MMENEAEHLSPVSISDLPNEVLEYILSLLSPYRDYKNVMLVCHRWNCIIKDVAEREAVSFHASLSDGSLRWMAHPPSPGGPTITERYSQSACYLNKCIYVFGGCTSKNTTFNDLWKLDLGSGEWIRPLAMGAYPSPKAYASLVSYDGKLILFGGWSHPVPLSLHQSPRFFQQLHTFTPETNSWTEVITTQSPPGLAGHGASVVGHCMVVFGGSKHNGFSCNDVWVFDFVDQEWSMKAVEGNKPLSRYGHAQMALDDDHILVAGGCGGPNMQFSDVWLLTLDPAGWRWEELTVLHPENSAPQLWCHPACKVGDKLVVLGKAAKSPAKSPTTYQPQFRSPKSSPSRGPETSPSHRETGHRADTHCCCCQEVALVDRMSLRAKRSHPETSESSSQESSSDNDDTAGLTPRGRAARHSLGRRDDRREPGPSKMSPPATTRPPGQLSPAATLPLSPPPTVPLLPQPPRTLGPSSSSPRGAAPPPGPVPLSPGGRDGPPSIRPNAMRNRQKQLEMLKRYEDRIRGQRAKETVSKTAPAHPGSCCHGAGGSCRVLARPRAAQNPAYVHTLDLAHALDRRTVEWLPLAACGPAAPEETIFYSLVLGRGELVMFGGIQTDMSTMRRHSQHMETFTNTVYYLSPTTVLR